MHKQHHRQPLLLLPLLLCCLAGQVKINCVPRSSAIVYGLNYVHILICTGAAVGSCWWRAQPTVQLGCFQAKGRELDCPSNLRRKQTRYLAETLQLGLARQTSQLNLGQLESLAQTHADVDPAVIYN
jgi:hypothetical protein